MVSAGSKGLNRKHEIKQNFGSFSVSSAEEKERERPQFGRREGFIKTEFEKMKEMLEQNEQSNEWR